MIVFVAGGTGYLGRALIPKLLERKHQVWALARPGSERKLPAGCRVVTGDALDGRSFSAVGADTWVHLVGTPHPAPWKGELFRQVDLRSVREGVKAACEAGIRHFVYVSVAHPAPVMKAYIAVRAEGEALIREAGLNATFVRPWYVLGPGHRWPIALKPFYALAEGWPRTREPARRLGLVTLEQMTAALVGAAERSAEGVRVVDVPGIIRAGGWS